MISLIRFRGSKCFAEELDEKGKPGPTFYENQKKFFLDAEPHRHKFKGSEKNKNIPKFFVWIDKDRVEHHLTYIQSRQFYCNFYERNALESKDFVKLKKMVDDGYNLQIVGYDAFPRDGTPTEMYNDSSKPMGHERVLFTMLTTPEIEWPWRKCKTFDF